MEAYAHACFLNFVCNCPVTTEDRGHDSPTNKAMLVLIDKVTERHSTVRDVCATVGPSRSCSFPASCLIVLFNIKGLHFVDILNYF